MKVLVTGGAGFIGSHLAAALVRRGVSVRVLDNFSTGSPENLWHIRDDVEVIKGSVTDTLAVERAVRGCIAVLHQAALPSVARSVEDPVGTHEVNVTGTLRVLTAARDAGVRRFVYASSSSIYGDDPTLPRCELTAPAPRSPYAVAKLAGEQYCRVFGRLFGMETVCLRYFNVFGPRQNPASRYAAVVPAFIESYLAHRPLILSGDGTQSRDFTHVDNVVQANLLAMQAPGVSGEVFNVGCGERFDLNLLIRELTEVFDYQPEIRRVPPRAGDVMHSLADISRARRLLRYEPIVGFRDGLRRTAMWFREDGLRRLAEARTM